MNPSDVSSSPVCLVVEDCEEDYRALERCVKRAGLPLQLKRCTDGKGVLDMLENTWPSLQGPAAIVLDLGLQGAVDGRTLLQAMRKHPILKRTLVVVFSASTDPADIDWCHQNGANAYQVKSIDTLSYQRVADLLGTYWCGPDVPALLHH